MSRDPYRSSTGNLGSRDYERVDRSVYETETKRDRSSRRYEEDDERDRDRERERERDDRSSHFEEDDEIAYSTRRRVPPPTRDRSPDDYSPQPPQRRREPSIGSGANRIGAASGTTFADDRVYRERERETRFVSRDDRRDDLRDDRRGGREERDEREEREVREEREYVSQPISSGGARHYVPAPPPDSVDVTKEKITVKVRDEEDDLPPRRRPVRRQSSLDTFDRLYRQVYDDSDMPERAPARREDILREDFRREEVRRDDSRRDDIRHEEVRRDDFRLEDLRATAPPPPAPILRRRREEVEVRIDDKSDIDGVADKFHEVSVDTRRRRYTNDDDVDDNYRRRSYNIATAPRPPPVPLQPAERVRETELIRTTRERSTDRGDRSYDRRMDTRRRVDYDDSLVDTESLVSSRGRRSDHASTIVSRSTARSISSSSTSSGGATLKSGKAKSEYPKKGKTRMPGRLVSERALADLGYPFVREGNTIVVQVALGQKNIDDVLKLSKDYKKSEEEMAETKKKRVTVTKTVGSPARHETVVEKEYREVETPAPRRERVVEREYKEVEVPAARREKVVEREYKEVEVPAPRRERVIEREVRSGPSDYVEEHRREEYYMTPAVQHYPTPAPAPPPAPTYVLPAQLPPPPVPIQVHVNTRPSPPPPPPQADVTKVYVRDVSPPDATYVSVRDRDIGTTTSTALTTTRARSDSRPIIIDAPGPLELSNDIPVGPAAIMAAESSPHYYHDRRYDDHHYDDHHYDDRHYDDDYEYDYDYVKRVERSRSRPARSRSRHSRHRHSRSFSRGDGALYARVKGSRSRSPSRHHHHSHSRSRSKHEIEYYGSSSFDDRALVRTKRLSTGELVVYEDEVERIEEPHRGARIEKDRKGNMAISIPKYR